VPAPAPLTTVVTATLAGSESKANQDHAIVTARAAVVLDGATSWLLQDPARDGGWYARALGAALTPRLDDPGRTLGEIVAQAVADLRDRYRLVPGDCPTSTVTIVRWDLEAVEIYTLGDSPAVVYLTHTEPVAVYDVRLEAVGAAARAAYRAYLLAGHGYDARLSTLIADLQLAERAERNRDGGYWIAESDPAAAAHAVTAAFPRDQVTAVLLASDGVSADVLDYRRHDWGQVLHLATADPAGYLRDLHAVEDADHDGRRWPRAKRHDDKTLALIAVTPCVGR